MIDYAIIIPAYNEEKLLPDTLRQVNAAMQSITTWQGEVIVVDNNSSDNTAAVARQAGAKVVQEKINQISRARNRGAAATAADTLIFLDADTILNAAVLRQALHNIYNQSCCAGGALVELSQPPPGIAINFFLKLWNCWSAWRKIAAGCFIYSTREAFTAVGGFNEKLYAGEELQLSRRLAAWGRKRQQDFTIITQPRIVTSARKNDWHSSFKLIVILLALMLFPPALRLKSCCSLWYKRPTTSK